MKLDTYIFQRCFRAAAYRGKSIGGRCRENVKKKKKRERKRRKLESFILGKGTVCVFGRIESTMLFDTRPYISTRVLSERDTCLSIRHRADAHGCESSGCECALVPRDYHSLAAHRRFDKRLDLDRTIERFDSRAIVRASGELFYSCCVRKIFHVGTVIFYDTRGNLEYYTMRDKFETKG